MIIASLLYRTMTFHKLERLDLFQQLPPPLLELILPENLRSLHLVFQANNVTANSSQYLFLPLALKAHVFDPQHLFADRYHCVNLMTASESGRRSFGPPERRPIFGRFSPRLLGSGSKACSALQNIFRI